MRQRTVGACLVNILLNEKLFYLIEVLPQIKHAVKIVKRGPCQFTPADGEGSIGFRVVDCTADLRGDIHPAAQSNGLLQKGCQQARADFTGKKLKVQPASPEIYRPLGSNKTLLLLFGPHFPYLQDIFMNKDSEFRRFVTYAAHPEPADRAGDIDAAALAAFIDDDASVKGAHDVVILPGKR